MVNSDDEDDYFVTGEGLSEDEYNGERGSAGSNYGSEDASSSSSSDESVIMMMMMIILMMNRSKWRPATSDRRESVRVVRSLHIHQKRPVREKRRRNSSASRME